MRMTPEIRSAIVSPRGNWNTAKNFFPEIDVDQSTGHVLVSTFESARYEKYASVETENIETSMSADGESLFIRGSVHVENWRNRKCSGSRQFCFAVFVGDSGHIYTHRAPATKGWMTAAPETITKRLRKLGIGAERVAAQQGDFLLKPANGSSYPIETFVHETMGAGHHQFAAPVLYADGNAGRQYRITETMLLRHHAVDGIQHPDQYIQPGIYIAGTTAMSLQTANLRD